VRTITISRPGPVVTSGQHHLKDHAYHEQDGQTHPKGKTPPAGNEIN
jgi:hypothetical protein